MEKLKEIWNGRSSRSQFLMISLLQVTFVIVLALVALLATLGDAGRFIILAFIPALIALTTILVVRRLNDIGWSRWLTLLYFVPWIQLIFVLVLFFKGSAPDESSTD